MCCITAVFWFVCYFGTCCVHNQVLTSEVVLLHVFIQAPCFGVCRREHRKMLTTRFKRPVMVQECAGFHVLPYAPGMLLCFHNVRGALCMWSAFLAGRCSMTKD